MSHSFRDRIIALVEKRTPEQKILFECSTDHKSQNLATLRQMADKNCLYLMKIFHEGDAQNLKVVLLPTEQFDLGWVLDSLGRDLVRVKNCETHEEETIE